MEKVEELARAKKEERELRDWLASRLFTVDAKGCFPEGTNHKVIDGVCKARLVGKLSREVLVESMNPTIMELAAMGCLVSADIVKQKFELSLSAYRKLTDAERLVAERMLLTKPGAPELDIELLPEPPKQ